MNSSWLQLLIYPVLGVVLFKIYNRLPIDLTERDTCPLCYGEDYCSEFEENVSLKYDTFIEVIFNLMSVKNVYFAKNGDAEIVIKKLADTDEFIKLNQLKFNYFNNKDITELLITKYRNFQVCDIHTAKLLIKKFPYKNLMNLWTLVRVNAEPLLLEVFGQQDKWPVPKLFGYCGRAVFVENCGVPLNNIQDFDWHSRAYIALQLLNALEKFTFAHQEFRLYLTDISPDNIVVDPQTLNIAFIDLEHGILQRKISETTYHHTEHISDDEYGFVTEEVCGSHVSDHNIYSVCMLVLSPSSPWPMMHNGLLHSSPRDMDNTALFEQIDFCVYSPNKTSRFLHSRNIRDLLGVVLEKHNSLFTG